MSAEPTGQGGPTAVRTFTLSWLAFAIVVVLGEAARADALTNFTVTDLGAGTPTFSTGANGGIVTVGNGATAYSFLPDTGTALNAAQVGVSQIPVVAGAPIGDPNTYGDPSLAYSMPVAATTNGQGTYVAIDASGVYGHMGSAEVYSVQQNANGSWTNPVALWSGGEQSSGMPGTGQASIVGINKLGEVLGSGSLNAVTSSTSLSQPYLYNLNTNTLLDLYSVGALQAGGWNNLVPIAIDDQGRILLEASPNPTSGDGSVHTLLLTPEGVSPDAFSVPEPGTLAMAVMTIAAVAWRRALRRRG